MPQGVMKSQPCHKPRQGSPLPGTLLCRENVCVACEREGQEVSQKPTKLSWKCYLPYPQVKGTIPNQVCHWHPSAPSRASSSLCSNPHASHLEEKPRAPANLAAGILKTEEQIGQPASERQESEEGEHHLCVKDRNKNTHILAFAAINSMLPYVSSRPQ